MNSDLTPGKPPPRLTREMIEAMNRDGKALIVGGGGVIMRREQDESLSGWQFNIRLGDLMRLRIPLIVWSIGLNIFPYDKSLSNEVWWHIGEVQKLSKLFSVRNFGTSDAFEKHGLNRPEVTPDPAVYRRYEKVYGFSQYKKQNKFLLGLCWAGDRPNLRFCDGNYELTIDKLCREMSTFLEFVGDGLVVYIPHLVEDRRFATYFRDRLGNKFIDASELYPEMFPENLSFVPKLGGIYSEMDLVVGMRGHSNIIPFAHNTPFIGLGEHVKNKFFCAEHKVPILDNTCQGFSKMAASVLSEHARREARVLRHYDLSVLDKFAKRVIAVTE